jgi:hypothetical protein
LPVLSIHSLRDDPIGCFCLFSCLLTKFLVRRESERSTHSVLVVTFSYIFFSLN